jgi:hypothetical protein
MNGSGNALQHEGILHRLTVVDLNRVLGVHAGGTWGQLWRGADASGLKLLAIARTNALASLHLGLKQLQLGQQDR